MNRNPLRWAWLAAVVMCGLGTVPVRAGDQALRLANILTDNMVLQRDQPVTIWGWARPGAQVTVTITEDGDSVASLVAKAPQDPPYTFQAKNVPPPPAQGQYHVTPAFVEHNARPFRTLTATTTADAQGGWQVRFPPMPTSFTPKTIVAQSGQEVDAAQNVLVGIVWLNTGQSNIERRGFNGSELELPGARYPAVRYCKIDGSWYKPKADLDQPAHWLVCSPQTAGEMPGVSYFFAVTLHRYLNVPVGIINNARGGTTGQAWCSREELDGIDHPVFRKQLAEYDALCRRWESPDYRKQVYDAAVAEAQAKVDAYKKALAAYEALPADQRKNKRPPKPPKLKETRILRDRQLRSDPRAGWSPPAGLFNAVVYPLRNLKVDGMIFYQGENNNFGLWSRYEYTFPRVITSHRKLFGRPDLPIGVIELPGWKMPREPEVSFADGYAFIRDIHRRVTGRFEHCDMIGCNDLGGQSIHPGDKRPVGLRAARWALATVYGQPIAYRGAVYRQMKIAQDNKTGRKIIRLYFDLDPLYEKQIAKELADNPDKKLADWVILPCPRNGGPYKGFAIAGPDRIWYPAQVVRNAAERALEASSPFVPNPVAVRYGWANFPAGNAFHRGLPLHTFRTDDWPLPDSWAENAQQKQALEQSLRRQLVEAGKHMLERQMAQCLMRLAELDAQRYSGKFDDAGLENLLLGKIDHLAKLVEDLDQARQQGYRRSNGNPALEQRIEQLKGALQAVEAEIRKSAAP